MDNLLNDADELKRAAAKQAEAIIVDAIPIDEPNAGEQKSSDPAADFAMFAKLCVGLVIRALEAKDPKWKPEPGEADAIADALGPVLDKYLPGWLEKFGAEAALCIAVGMYALPRITQPATPKPKQPASEGAKP